MNPYYLLDAGVELSTEYMELLEKSMDWKKIKEDFERDRNRVASVFYGM